MIDVDEEILRKLLEKFTYRPGWHFSIEDKTLVIRAMVIDTDCPAREIPLSFAVGIPSMVHHKFPWQQWLFDQIMEVERHEAQEFFKIDGVKVYDPHG